ncbi:MAG: peptide ABC transporter substrate-binding protein [Planctomycetota bacterium]
MRWAVPLILLALLLPAAVFNFGFGRPLPELPPDKTAITFAVPSPVKTLDPQRATALNDFRIIDALFEPLLTVDPETLQLVPGAAHLPEVSDDATTYTFTIRDDARWSNGDPVTSHDFKHAWFRALLPDLAAGYSGKFMLIKGAKPFFEWRTDELKQLAQNPALESGEQAWQETLAHFDATVGLQTPDDRTLIVTLEKPTAYFPDLAGFGVFSPVHKPTASAALNIDPDTSRVTVDPRYFIDPHRLISNGPYTLTEWAFGRRMVLDANPYYHSADRLGNDRIVQRLIRGDQLQLLAYENGEVDWLPGIASDLIGAELIKSGRPDIHSIPSAGTYFYIFNCRPTLPDGSPNPLADPALRRALARCIDRQTIVDRVTRKNQPIATTFTPAGAITGYTPPADAAIPYDPDAARQILRDAGYSVKGSAGKPLPILKLVYNTEGPHEGPALAITRHWKDQLGIEVTTEKVEWNRLLDLRDNGDFVIARGGWFGDYVHPSTFLELFRSGDNNNDGAYANPEVDQLLNTGRSFRDPAQGMPYYQDAERLILNDAPIAPIYYYTQLHLFDPNRVQDFTLNAWNKTALHRIRVTPE